MENLLTPVSTTTIKRSQQPAPSVAAAHSTYASIDTPETALKALKDQPDFDTVGRVLNYLDRSLQTQDGFSIATPGPLSAQIINALVTITIPDYWRTFRQSGRNIPKLIKCLQNCSGLGAILSRLRPLIADCRQKKRLDQTRDASEHIEDLLDVLSRILKSNETSLHIWTNIQTHAPNSAQRNLLWKEYISLVASGRVLSMAAQAEDALKERGVTRDEVWLSNGNEYAAWLGRNIACIICGNLKTDDLPLLAQICGKSLTLGYNDRIIASIIAVLLDTGSIAPVAQFLSKLAAHDQRQFLNSTITFFSTRYFNTVADEKKDVPLKSQLTISGVAHVIHELIRNNDLLKSHIVALLTNSTISALDDSLFARRSLVASIANDEEKLQNVVEKCLGLFGDKFYITHAPMIQQEALAQILAISCGYAHRSQPLFLTMTTKSSMHSNAISNRIGVSSPRARLLGMFLGEAISVMVDKPELRLKFGLEGNEAEEAKWYQHLTRVEDKIGKLEDLRESEKPSGKLSKPPAKATRPSKPKEEVPKKSLITEMSGPRIVEIESESDDDDLIPYAKPDSDPEDDTEDPTEINRNKPTAPVYIRDLLTYLRDSEDYDRQLIGLTTAAPLIRRKANFGTEVTDHIEQLANVLVGMSDNFDLPNFAELRQQALIAVLLVKPGPMAQWFARGFFTGDYSLTQRIAMLTTLGLGARELAGFKEPSETPIPIPETPAFPSKVLPPRLHKIYAAETAPVAALTSRLAKATLEPMALSAADKLAGPDILKVRTFSSRMDVEKKRKKPIPNALAQIVADNFFFPLTGRWWVNMQSSISGSATDPDNNLYTSQHLLPPFLQTLAIVLHASGPNTLSLPQMTREFWDLLLSVRGFAVKDKAVLRAVLFAFLMLFETNEDQERLATEQGKELMETQEWVKNVFEGLGGDGRIGGGRVGGDEEDGNLRGMAAGVLVRCGELVEKWRRKMVGSLLDY